MTNSITVVDYFLPGEEITDIKSKERQTIIGPGLQRDKNKPNSLVVTQAGRLHFRAPNTYWIENRKTRYVPKRGDLVVGIITKKSGDVLKVDIGSAELANLSTLAFEGATKKMKPEVEIGDIVYAKLLNAYKDMEPELVCVDQYYKAGPLGVLTNDGFLINVNLKLVYFLLNVSNPLLGTLTKKFPYEIVIGLNGKVWMKANKAKDILTMCRVFEASENHSEKSISDTCRGQK
ncbi:hypothetical protein ABEB36_008236 [Hypothenemus hampei]|uniref:Ribosomal RNA-processing protein 40 n=1 Tax=Hypothenemus hampei TaxID=57062 RepID=A0ABD1EL71_HYPHA